jgi:hypothetical protein
MKRFPEPTSIEFFTTCRGEHFVVLFLGSREPYVDETTKEVVSPKQIFFMLPDRGLEIPNLQTEEGIWYNITPFGELDWQWWKQTVPDYPIWMNKDPNPRFNANELKQHKENLTTVIYNSYFYKTICERFHQYMEELNKP